MSLLGCACKTLESIIHSPVTSRVRNAIISNQHSFVAGRSSPKKLVGFMEHATAVEDRSQLDAIHCYLSNALMPSPAYALQSFPVLTFLIRSSHCCTTSSLQATVCTVKDRILAWTLPQVVRIRALSLGIFFYFFLMMFRQQYTTQHSCCTQVILKYSKKFKTSPMAHWCNVTSPYFLAGATQTSWYFKVQKYKKRVVSYTHETDDIHFIYHITEEHLTGEYAIRDIRVPFHFKLIVSAHTS